MEMNPQSEGPRRVAERLGPQLDQARQGLADLNGKITTFIRQNPGMCLLGAVALGFVVGKIASRR